MRIDFRRPGAPTDRYFIESSDGSLCDECLNVHWVESMGEAGERIETWRIDYNESRSHQALQEETPKEFALRIKELERSEISQPPKLTLEVVQETRAAREGR